MSEIATISQLLDVHTGELLPATVENAATVLQAARAMRETLSDVVATATAYLAEESSRQGTKTLHAGTATITLTGGPTIEYDATDLQALLMEAGCPSERITEAVVAEVTYKVNRAVLRQLAAANPNYKAAIELAERPVEKPIRASVR